MKNSECTIEQYRGGKLVRSFTPTTDKTYAWNMNVNGKSYRRTHGWVLSKILPTLVDGSPFATKVVPNKSAPIPVVRRKRVRLDQRSQSTNPRRAPTSSKRNE